MEKQVICTYRKSQEYEGKLEISLFIDLNKEWSDLFLIDSYGLRVDEDFNEPGLNSQFCYKVYYSLVQTTEDTD